MPSQFGGLPSGVAKVMFCLMERWTGRDDATFVLRSPWRRDQLPQGLRDSRLEVVVVPRPKTLIFDVIAQTFTVPHLCRGLGIDVVLNADPYGARAGGKARVTIVHDLYFQTLPQQIGARARLTTGLAYDWVLAASTRIVTVSDATRSDLAHWRAAYRRKAVTIHSDAAPNATAPLLERPVPGPYVLFVGNATPNKNFGFAARALSSLSQTHPDLAIVHVGHDHAEVIKAELDRLGSPLALYRRFDLSSAELTALYRDAVCLVVPSLAEGFCLPIVEAQDTGCPVVCADVSAMPEIAGEGALLYPAGDAEALSASVERLLSDPVAREDVVTKGRGNRARFSWATAADAYLETLRDALASAEIHR